jgi:hypothetical protein
LAFCIISTACVGRSLGHHSSGHSDDVGVNYPLCHKCGSWSSEFRYEYEDNVFDFVSCTVAAPAGDHIETAVNRLLRQNLVQDFNSPIEMNVRKRACFFVENMMPGGRSWSCGWLDKENNLIHQPVLEDAQRAIQDSAWRMGTREFNRE